MPETTAEFFAMPQVAQDTYQDVLKAISKSKNEKISLTRARKEVGVSRWHLYRFGRKALRKVNGRYVVKSHDTLLRVLIILTPQGLSEAAFRDSRQASILGKYWAAVELYLDTGGASALRLFEGHSVTDAEGKQIPLITDLRELERLGSAGVLSFETLYVKAG